MKIRHYLKISTFIFVIAFVVLSCEKDTLDLQEEVLGASRVKRISLEKLSSKIGNIPDYKNLSTLFDVNKQKRATQQKALEPSDQAWIMTDEIVMIERDDATFYTFRIGTTTEQNEFYNFVLGINYDNTLRSMRILEYIPSDNWSQDSSQPFVGEVKLQENNIFSFEDVLSAFSEKSGGQCITGVSTSWSCNAGENHAPNTCLAGGSDSVVTVQWGPCPPELTTGDDGNDNSGFPVNTGSGGTGGSGGSVVNPNDECIPTIENPCPDDETIILPPIQDSDEIDCEEQKQRLLNLVNNPTISSHINSLKNGIYSDQSTNYKEDGVRFAKTGTNQYTPRYPNERNGNSVDYTPDYESNEVVSVHIHQTKFWNLAVSPSPFFNAPVPSHGDIIELMKNVKHIKDTNELLVGEVTQIVMTETGIFAIVMEPSSAISALNALQDQKELDEFKIDFQRKVLGEWEKINQNAGEECDGDCLEDVAKKFKKFMKKLKIGSIKVKAKVLRATIGNNNQITGWICDE